MSSATGEYALGVSLVGDHFDCRGSELFVPALALDPGELEPLALQPSSSNWKIVGLGLIAMNDAAETLVEVVEATSCPPDVTICVLSRQDLLVLATSDETTRVYGEGEPAPGLPDAARFASLLFGSFDGPNASGQVALTATVFGLEETARALYRWDPNGGLELLAASGDPAFGDGSTLDVLDSPKIDDSGAVTWWGRAVGGAVDESDDEGIWTARADGATWLRFREDIDSGPVSLPLFANEAGDVAFMTDRAIMADRVLWRRLWQSSSDGALRVRLRKNDPVPDVPFASLLDMKLQHLDDAGRAIVSRRNAYYLLEPDDELAVLVALDALFDLGPEPPVRANAAYLSFDRDLQHFALDVWHQDYDTGEQSSGLFVPVPEPGTKATILAALATIAWIRRRELARARVQLTTGARLRRRTATPRSPQSAIPSRTALPGSGTTSMLSMEMLAPSPKTLVANSRARTSVKSVSR